VATKELALPMTDWTKAGESDLAAFDALMVRYQRQVIGTALRILGNRDDALDAAQEVFFRLYQHRGRVEENPGPWLYRVTVNVCFDLRRRRREFPMVEGFEPSPEQPAFDAELDQERRRAIVKQALRHLPEKERAAIVLREIEGLSTAEVAAALGTSEVTVRSNVSTGKAKLRQFCAGLMRRRK
jgi:RNA polymerase sigma-70 factor (ECF subfamily)